MCDGSGGNRPHADLKSTVDAPNAGIPGQIRAVSDGTAARWLAGRRPGHLARCPGTRRRLAGAHRRPGSAPRSAGRGSATSLLTLAEFGMESDEPVAYQSERSALYEAAFGRLRDQGRVYGCACTRSEIEGAAAAGGLPLGHLSRHLPSRHRRTRDPRLALPGRGHRVLQRSGRRPAVAGPRAGGRRFRRAPSRWTVGVSAGGGRRRRRAARDGRRPWHRPDRQHATTDRPAARARPAQLRATCTSRSSSTSAARSFPSRPGRARSNAPIRSRELERAGRHLGLPTIGADSIASFQRAAVTAWTERWRIEPR